MTTSNEHNNAPAVLEQELSALLTTSLPYMTPVGRARLGQDIAQLYSSVSAPAVPQGLERYEPTVMVEESRGRLTATGAVMKPKEDGRWVRLRDLTATPAPAPAPAQEIDKSVADAEIKSMYVESQGSDKGWLGIEGSYFIGGVVAARQKAAPAPAQLTDEERADMACAVAAICTGASSRTVAATAIEWTERALRAKGGK